MKETKILRNTKDAAKNSTAIRRGHTAARQRFLASLLSLLLLCTTVVYFSGCNREEAGGDDSLQNTSTEGSDQMTESETNTETAPESTEPPETPYITLCLCRLANLWTILILMTPYLSAIHVRRAL